MTGCGAPCIISTRGLRRSDRPDLRLKAELVEGNPDVGYSPVAPPPGAWGRAAGLFFYGSTVLMALASEMSKSVLLSCEGLQLERPVRGRLVGKPRAGNAPSVGKSRCAVRQIPYFYAGVCPQRARI